MWKAVRWFAVPSTRQTLFSKPELFSPRCVLLSKMLTFLLWCILLVLCWPLALAALVLYPIVWLILLPFRIIGMAVGGVLELVWAIVTLPFTIIRRLA
jgi:hypothetical protein